MSFRIAIGTLGLAASTLYAQAPTRPALDTSLARVDSLWARSYAANDTSIALELMSRDFTMWSGNRMKDRAAELGDIRATPGLTMKYFRTSGVKTHRVGSVAVVTGVADWSFEMGGKTSAYQRRYTGTYKKGGSLGWQLVGLQMSTAPAAEDANLRKKVEALCAAMVDAFKKNPALVGPFYTDDAKMVGGGAVYAGRKVIDDYWAGATGFPGWTLDVLEVGSDTHGPWVIGRSNLTSPGGRAMITNFVGLLRADADGKLRFALDMYAAATP